MDQKMKKLKSFLVKVEDYYQKNEQTKFHHKPKVSYGKFDPNENQIIEIKTQREQTWNKYKNLIMNSEKCLFEKQKAEKLRQRILRVSQKVFILIKNYFSFLLKDFFINHFFFFFSIQPQYQHRLRKKILLSINAKFYPFFR